MTKDEHQSLEVIARLTPDLLFTKDTAKQCMPCSCSRPKGHNGPHILLLNKDMTDEKVRKLMGGEDV